jgi:Tfp pilus assembly protein PilO
MPRNFELPDSWAALKDPRMAARALLGTLVVATLIATYFVFFPLGGSAEEIDRQLTSLRAQIRERRQALDHAKTIAVKVEKGRDQGDAFMDRYFLRSGNAYSTIVTDLVESAKRAQIKAKDHSYQTEPIEGSEDLSMMSIVGGYEGTYSDLLHFVNEIDRSKRLIIIQSLQAQPQQGSGGVLNIAIRFDAFVKEDLPAQSAAAATPVGGQP